jgi:hypothetical protein
MTVPYRAVDSARALRAPVRECGHSSAGGATPHPASPPGSFDPGVTPFASLRILPPQGGKGSWAWVAHVR